MNKAKERIGEKWQCNNGEYVKIIGYNNRNDVLIEFENGGETKIVSYPNIRKGNIAKSIDYSYRVGEEKTNIQNIKMKILEYVNSENITVEFENGEIVKNKTYSNFIKGKLKSKMHPSVYGVGFIGNGKYNCCENRAQTKEYGKWIEMIRRCYSKGIQYTTTSYSNCTVCEEWYNFQNFAEWYNNNVWNDEFCFLDKDILIKGNKLYSPNTCIFVDNRINCLFVKSDKKRGKYPIGVIKVKEKYIAKCRDGYGNSINLGYFDSETVAFNAYKVEKENVIKKVADDYSRKYPKFPQKLCEAMYKYKVEITD